MSDIRAVADSGLVQRTHALGITLDEIKNWVAGPHAIAMSQSSTAEIREIADDLAARLRKLQAEPSTLVVVLMGGTGVGKSTLLNALAGAKIADASMVRPTTTQPTVYRHRDLNLAKLDPLFAKCRESVHDRASLRQKILIDTPDIDGNVTEHHDRLREILPLADAVLYVGSQEKYHDREGWNLLIEHRAERGFAFVLNKWDRCLGLIGDRSGASPLDDFKKTLKEAGFSEPLVFRTCAGQWFAAASTDSVPNVDDDFKGLQDWLDRGLDEAAVRTIKARGIAGSLEMLVDHLEKAQPPDFSRQADSLKSVWNTALKEAVADEAKALVRAADRHANSFEQHLRGLGRQQFTGMFAKYLKVVDWIAKPKLTPSLPSMPKRTTPIEDLADRCVATIPDETRHALEESVHNRLLAIADQKGFPIAGLEANLPSNRGEWLSNDILLTVAREELIGLEKDYAEPSVGRAGLQRMTAFASKWLPSIAIGGLLLQFLYDALWNHEIWGVGQFIGAFLILALVFVALHFVVSKIFPVQWDGLRTKLQRDFERRLSESISPVYFSSAEKLIAAANDERARLEPALRICRDLRTELGRSSTDVAAHSLFAKSR